MDGSDEAKGASALWGLYAVVFLCGMALMGIEIAGVRLQEPAFGSTVYVWGAIIGVFMLAMSLGYYLGGRLADRHPRLAVLGVIILIAGATAFLPPWLAAPLCRTLNAVENLDPKLRALFASCVLFLVPSLLLGMVSPYAIRLSATRMSALGRAAGSLYAVSTCGSLVGTFLTSFVLVEFMGSQMMVWLMGAVLVATGAACLVASTKTRVGAVASVALAVLVAGAGWRGAKTPLIILPAYANENETLESPYHHITICEQYSLVDPQRRVPARYMMFNNQIESGIELDGPPLERDAQGLPLNPATGLKPIHPVRTACGYVRMLHLGLLFTQQPPKRMLVIGCGGGVGPMMFKEHFPGQVDRIDVVDIDPRVFEMAEKYFDYPYTDDPVIASYAVDGRLFVDQRPDDRWDYIVMDAYTSGGRIPKHLATREFFETLKSRLAPGGVFLANIISRADKPRAGRDTSRLFRAMYKTLETVYDAQKPDGGNIYVFPRRRDAQADGENIIVIATPADGGPRLSRQDIERRHSRFSGTWLAHVPIGEFVQRYLPPSPEFGNRPAPVDDVPVLTDDFCPTDSMVYQ